MIRLIIVSERERKLPKDMSSKRLSTVLFWYVIWVNRLTFLLLGFVDTIFVRQQGVIIPWKYIFCINDNIQNDNNNDK